MRNSSLERNRMFIRFFGFGVRFSGSASGVVLWGRVIAAGRARDGLLAIGGWVLRGGQPRGRSRGVNRVDAHARSTWRRIEVPLPGALMISTRASIRLARWN